MTVLSSRQSQRKIKLKLLEKNQTGLLARKLAGGLRKRFVVPSDALRGLKIRGSLPLGRSSQTMVVFTLDLQQVKETISKGSSPSQSPRLRTDTSTLSEKPTTESKNSSPTTPTTDIKNES